MSKILFLVAGKPGSGKSTASKLAATKLGNVYHFSMGDELRARGLFGKASKHSEEAKRYANEMKQSLPVPASLSAKVFEECVQTSPYDTIIVDGYPQYQDRLLGFSETIERVDATIAAIFKIDISDKVAFERLSNRKQRTDAEEDHAYIAKRLQGYIANVVPTVSILAKDYPLIVIDGNQPPEQVAADLEINIKTYRLQVNPG